MKIILDVDYDNNGLIVGQHVFDTTEMVSDPAAPAGTTTATMKPVDYLAWLQANPDKQQAAGWATKSKLPAVPQGTTRWHALVTQIHAPNAPAELQALQSAVSPVVVPLPPTSA